MLMTLKTPPCNVTLKIDTSDLSHMVHRHILKGFNMQVKYSYPSSLQKDQIQDRYDFLMKMFDL